MPAVLPLNLSAISRPRVHAVARIGSALIRAFRIKVRMIVAIQLDPFRRSLIGSFQQQSVAFVGLDLQFDSGPYFRAFAVLYADKP